MVYFEYINDTIANREQRTTIVLRENNGSYPINIKIAWYDEIISAGVEIIPDHLLAIVYDPPGDHSFGQISSGTTITKGFSITKEDSKTFVDEWKTLYFGQGKDTGLAGILSDVAGVLTDIPGLGDVLQNALPGLGLPPGQHEFSKSITRGTTTDYEFSVTYRNTFTSSLNTEDPELIGPGGGDLYYGTGMIIYWTIKHRVRYINTTTASNVTTDQLKLWNGSNWMEYGLAFNTSFTVLGAYLDEYGLGNLTRFNPFLDENFNYENYDYLHEYQTGTMFWTPDYITELESGQQGELLLRGPQVMKGYWRNPEATKRTLIEDENGNIWLSTGDVAYMDENGYFFIVGRTKEQIKYKGYRVLPAEVEDGLFQHPAVLECGVIGIPDELSGETIKAFVKLKPEYEGKITEQEIIDWAKENMKLCNVFSINKIEDKDWHFNFFLLPVAVKKQYEERA